MAYQLHDGYKDNDRDSPTNMRSDKIKNLCRTLLQYRLKQYQRPITTRWQYQLKTGEQYLERREIHLQFVTWFIPQLENSKNVPASYLKKWKYFKDWLQDPALNFQVKCMVKFGRTLFLQGSIIFLA